MVGVLKFMVSVIVSYFLLQLRPSALFSKRPFSFSPFLVLALALCLFFCFASLRSHSTTHTPTAPKKKNDRSRRRRCEAKQYQCNIIQFDLDDIFCFSPFVSELFSVLSLRKAYKKSFFFFGAYKSKMEHRV